jgi:two-component system nitrogen regulation sensor histidine kinase GlnL
MPRSPIIAKTPTLLDSFEGLDWLVSLVAILEPQGRVMWANSALEDALQASKRSLAGLELHSCVEDKKAFAQALRGAVANEFSSIRFDAVLKRAEQDDLPVHVVMAPQHFSDGSPCVLVEMLVLEQHSRQERTNRLMDQSEANKELVRNLAHEIKNPLGGIRGAAQLLQMDLESKELISYTEVIIHEADRLQALVDRLLAPHRKPHVVTDVNIHEVCERVRTLLLMEHAKGLDVVRDYDLSIPEFRGDREQLIQVVLNIAQNAAQAMLLMMEGASATLTLRTRVQRQVTIRQERHKLALDLQVIDDGPGIADELRDRIFYPLVSGREGGSGLGLTLAQTFVHQHHGMIEFESKPGRTVFHVLIPLP